MNEYGEQEYQSRTTICLYNVLYKGLYKGLYNFVCVDEKIDTFVHRANILFLVILF